MRRWYAAFDAFLLTSANEGTPVVAIEALAARGARSSQRTPAAPRPSSTTARPAFSRRSATRRRSRRGSHELAREPALRPLVRRRAGARRMRERFSIGADGGRRRRALRRGCSRREGPPHPQGHGHRRRRAAPAGAAARAARARGRRALPRRSTSPETTHRGSTRSSTQPASRAEHVRCTSTSARAGGRRHASASAKSAPDLVHTHMVHADVYGSIASQRCCASPFVSTRHNDDRYLLGPFRHVDRAFMHRRRAGSSRSRTRCATFHIRAGLPAREAGDDPLRPRRASRSAPSELTPERRRDPAGRAARARDRTPDRAEGPRDAARGLRPRRARRTRMRVLAILGWGPLEAETRALVRELGLDGRGRPARPRRDPRLARARGRLRAHLALGGLRHRAARGDARRACRSSRRGSARCPRSSSTARPGCSSSRATRGASRRRSTGCSPTRGGAGARRGRARTRALADFSVARMADAHDRRVYEGMRLRMKEIGLRELVTGGAPRRPRRALSIWFHGHNNPRYAELLPRLERLDACLLRCPTRASRAASASAPSRRRSRCATARCSARRRAATATCFTLDFDQLAAGRAAVVMDADDPFFTPREIELLKQPVAPRVRRHRRARRAALRVARRREAVGRDPAGREPRAATPELIAPRRRAEEAAGRGRARLDGRAPADGRRPRTPRTRSTTSTTCSSSGSRSTRAARRAALARRRAERARARAARRRDDVVALGPAAARAGARRRREFDVAPYARTQTRASGPRRSRSSSASACRPSRTTTR